MIRRAPRSAARERADTELTRARLAYGDAVLRLELALARGEAGIAERAALRKAARRWDRAVLRAVSA